MARPLIISDCDGVLVEFARPFTDYLLSEHRLTLRLDSFALAGNIRDAEGTILPMADFPPLLQGFFTTHMPHQPAVPGAVEALAQLARWCDVVVLTNIEDVHAATRTDVLQRLGMPYRVISNQGGKGRAIRALLDEFQPNAAVFIDDLPPNHSSAAKLAPEVHRLHMVAEHGLRHLIPAAPDAHARIDDWADALPHIETHLMTIAGAAA
jgi:ribonucleotide monophosphatase NagD (HAD superfamily)